MICGRSAERLPWSAAAAILPKVVQTKAQQITAAIEATHTVTRMGVESTAVLSGPADAAGGPFPRSPGRGHEVERWDQAERRRGRIGDAAPLLWPVCCANDDDRRCRTLAAVLPSVKEEGTYVLHM